MPNPLNKQLDSKYILVHGFGWHQGVLGIVASRLVEKFQKPSFVISNDTGPALLVSLSRTPVVWLVNENAVSLSNKPIGKIIKISSNSIRDITVEKVKEIVLKENLI